MKKIIFVLFLIVNVFAGEIIEMLPYKNSEFSPALKESFPIEFILKKDSNVSVEIYTPDNNLIRTLNKSFKKGKNKIIWDGKDSKGVIVPDEAYNIVLKADKEVLDFRDSGGKIIKDLKRKIDKRGKISYKLSKPSRVLIRAGIQNGPMLRVISNWIPKNKGLIVQRWNMKDKDEIIDISKYNFAISISAFELPKYAIITTNNKTESYLQYFKRNHFKCNKKSKKNLDKGFSKHSYSCRLEEKEPNLKMQINNVPLNSKNTPILTNGKLALVKVSMNSEDEELFEKVKYEVSFFVDLQFTSEEELGYMPISWNFNPNGLKKGEHILTVNVSSFDGKVGVKNLGFMVE